MKANAANKKKSIVIKAVHLETGKELIFESKAAAVKAGFDKSSIERCILGHVNHHKGYKWSLN